MVISGGVVDMPTVVVGDLLLFLPHTMALPPHTHTPAFPLVFLFL